MNYACCFAGHRQLPYRRLTEIKLDTECAIRMLIHEGVTDFYCGAARGFDLMAAECVLHLKQFFPQIKLYLILPCKTQTEFWGDADKQKYSFVLSHADGIDCLYEQYTKSCMYERNRALVQNSAHCICYLTDTKSGTAYTVAYAAKRNLNLIPVGLEEEEVQAFDAFLSSNQLSFDDIA